MSILIVLALILVQGSALRWASLLPLHRVRSLVPGPRGSRCATSCVASEYRSKSVEDAERLGHERIGRWCSPDR